jgi:hypothetical protein
VVGWQRVEQLQLVCVNSVSVAVIDEVKACGEHAIVLRDLEGVEVSVFANKGLDAMHQ